MPVRSTPVQSTLALPAGPRIAFQAIPDHSMPAVPCSASIAPGLVTPCLPIPAVNTTRATPAAQAQPSLRYLPRLPIRA
jgi:hypothetical protein